METDNTGVSLATELTCRRGLLLKEILVGDCYCLETVYFFELNQATKIRKDITDKIQNKDI